MTIKTDLIKHKLLVQKFGTKEAFNFYEQFKKLNKAQFKKDELENKIQELLKSELQNLAQFGSYESRFNAKIYTKYLKKPIKPVLINEQIIGELKLPLSLHKESLTLKRSISKWLHNCVARIMQARSDAQIQNKDPKPVINDLFNGLFKVQSRALITTCVNCVMGNVRIMF